MTKLKSRLATYLGISSIVLSSCVSSYFSQFLPEYYSVKPQLNRNAQQRNAIYISKEKMINQLRKFSFVSPFHENYAEQVIDDNRSLFLELTFEETFLKEYVDDSLEVTPTQTDNLTSGINLFYKNVIWSVHGNPDSLKQYSYDTKAILEYNDVWKNTVSTTNKVFLRDSLGAPKPNDFANALYVHRKYGITQNIYVSPKCVSIVEIKENDFTTINNILKKQESYIDSTGRVFQSPFDVTFEDHVFKIQQFYFPDTPQEFYNDNKKEIDSLYRVDQDNFKKYNIVQQE